MPDPRIDRLWAELSQLRVELRRISTQQIRSELTGAQTDINTLESDVAALPQGVLGYAEVTSTQSGIGPSETDLTGLSVTVNVGASRRVKITGHGQIGYTTAGQVVAVNAKESATQLGTITRHRSAASNSIAQVDGSLVVQPSEGSHTYRLVALANADTFDFAAAALVPAFILVTDIGPA